MMLAVNFAAADDSALTKQFAELQPTLRKLCFECHSTEAKEGELDLERFSSVELVRQDVKP